MSVCLSAAHPDTRTAQQRESNSRKEPGRGGGAKRSRPSPECEKPGSGRGQPLRRRPGPTESNALIGPSERASGRREWVHREGGPSGLALPAPAWLAHPRTDREAKLPQRWALAAARRPLAPTSRTCQKGKPVNVCISTQSKCNAPRPPPTPTCSAPLSPSFWKRRRTQGGLLPGEAAA